MPPSQTRRCDRMMFAHTADTRSTNKRLIDEVASVPSKRLRNKISGCE